MWNFTPNLSVADYEAQLVRRCFMNTRIMLGAAFLLSAWPILAAEDPAHALRPTADVTWIAFTPDSKQLLTGGDAVLNLGDEFSYELRLWSVETGKLVAKTMKSSGVSDPGLAISADGRLAAVASRASVFNGNIVSLTVYDLDTRKVLVGPIKIGALGVGLVNALAFRPDGSMLAIAFSRRGGDIPQPSTEVQLWAIPLPPG